MTNVLWIAFITLAIYSTISTIMIILTKENENVIAFFGMGMVGCCLFIVIRIIRCISNKFKYRIGKRSICENIETGERYTCKVSEADDIDWLKEYEVVEKYAEKSQWKDLPCFSEEFIEKSKINCGRCIHKAECKREYPYDKLKCQHTDDHITKFDKFEKKIEK